MIGYSLILAILLILPVQALAQVMINEVDLQPSSSDETQWVELYNTSKFAVDVGGWSLTSLSKNMTVYVQQGTIINASGYLVVRDGGWMSLVNETVVLRDHVGRVIGSAGNFSEAERDMASWQRYPNGADTWSFLFRTPGKSNGGFLTGTINATEFEPAERFTFNRFALTDQAGRNVTSAEVQAPLRISAEIANNTYDRLPYAYIVQVKDRDGATASLSWIVGELGPKGTNEVFQTWIPEETGNYVVELFLWDGIVTASPLSFNVPKMGVSVEEEKLASFG